MKFQTFQFQTFQFQTFQFQTCEQLDCYSAGSAFSNLSLANSWLALGAVHKNTYVCSQQVKGVAQCQYF